jgi:hypothetical protein
MSISRNSQFVRLCGRGKFYLLGFEEEDCAVAEVEVDEMLGF